MLKNKFFIDELIAMRSQVDAKLAEKIGSMIDDILSTATTAFFHAMEHSTPSKFLEQIIATEADWSYLYAVHVLKGRFELGEPIIATDANHSYNYALAVLKGPFPLGEKIISTSEWHNQSYIKNIISPTSQG